MHEIPEDISRDIITRDYSEMLTYGDGVINAVGDLRRKFPEDNVVSALFDAGVELGEEGVSVAEFNYAIIKERASKTLGISPDDIDIEIGELKETLNKTPEDEQIERAVDFLLVELPDINKGSNSNVVKPLQCGNEIVKAAIFVADNTKLNAKTLQQMGDVVIDLRDKEDATMGDIVNNMAKTRRAGVDHTAKCLAKALRGQQQNKHELNKEITLLLDAIAEEKLTHKSL